MSDGIKFVGKDPDGLARAISTDENGNVNIKLTGSYSILSTETKPTGDENDTLLEYNVETGETKVFKFISGEWREL